MWRLTALPFPESDAVFAFVLTSPLISPRSVFLYLALFLQELEAVVVSTRENRGGSAQHATRKEEEEEEEKEEEVVVFTRDSVTSEDPPNTHQAQPRPLKPQVRLSVCVASVHA